TDLRVTAKNKLDLRRIDVLAAGNDHVLLAVDQIEIAVLVHGAEVAAAHPAVSQCVARSLRHVGVAGHGGGSVDGDLANRLWWKRIHIVIDDTHRAHRRRSADRLKTA